MEIGFIGAGKVGFTLGKHLAQHGFNLAGYYSRNANSARDAARFTATRAFESVEELVQACDMVFITVPDGKIAQVWDQVKQAGIFGKTICHTSGSLSSEVFEGIEERGAFGYSVHPLFPIHSKYDSYTEISRALIAIEGSEAHSDDLRKMFELMGHRAVVIGREGKTRYHAAAVFASNLMTGLFARAQKMLVSCGFSEDEATRALGPLFQGNCENILAKGPEGALTGPVERCDAKTCAHHLQVLDRHERDIYLSLSEELLGIAQRKNPERDYTALAQLIESERDRTADSDN